MNIRHTLACCAALGAFAGTACADDFLTELARTDGNVRGEYSRPQPAMQAARPTPEQIAFLQELARTDGNVAAVPVETPSERAVASR